MFRLLICSTFLTLAQFGWSQEPSSAIQTERNSTSNLEDEQEFSIVPPANHDNQIEEPHHELDFDESKKDFGRLRSHKGKSHKAKRTKKYVSDDTIAAILLAAGVILAFLAIFLPVLFIWIGAWAFLIAVLALALGLVLMVLSGNLGGPLDRFAIAMGFWGLLFLNLISLGLWAIIGAFFWW